MFADLILQKKIRFGLRRVLNESVLVSMERVSFSAPQRYAMAHFRFLYKKFRLQTFCFFINKVHESFDLNKFKVIKKIRQKLTTLLGILND